MGEQQATMEAQEQGLTEAQGCGEGCGCAHGEAGEGMLDMVQVAALRGFLSGIYASQLDADGLAEYLEAMGRQEGSEFQEGAKFLAAQFGGMRDGLRAEDPPAWLLLDAVAQDEGEEE